MKMKKALGILTLILISVMAKGQDTLEVNERTTLHLQCTSDIIYCDLGSNAIYAAAAPNVPQLLRVKASAPFAGETTLTIMTKDENLVTYIVRYTPHLKRYIISQKQNEEERTGIIANNTRDTSILYAINHTKATLNHIYDKTLKVEFNIDNIFSHHDKVYITVGIRNKSSISYTCDVTFVLSDINKSRNAAQEIMMVPTERCGHLSVEPGSATTATYAFDRLSISEGKQLKVNIYETEGYRNITLKIDSKDIANSKTYQQ